MSQLVMISFFSSLPLNQPSNSPPHNLPLNRAPSPHQVALPQTLISSTPSTMATNKLFASILIFSLLFLATFSSASGPCMPKPTPMPKIPKIPKKVPPVNPGSYSCPKDALKLGVCADLLGLVNLAVGSSSSKCCSLLTGLADLEVAACLCTAIKANVLGINLNVPLTLGLLVSACDKSLPPGYTC